MTPLLSNGAAGAAVGAGLVPKNGIGCCVLRVVICGGDLVICGGGRCCCCCVLVVVLLLIIVILYMSIWLFLCALFFFFSFPLPAWLKEVCTTPEVEGNQKEPARRSPTQYTLAPFLASAELGLAVLLIDVMSKVLAAKRTGERLTMCCELFPRLTTSNHSVSRFRSDCMAVTVGDFQVVCLTFVSICQQCS